MNYEKILNDIVNLITQKFDTIINPEAYNAHFFGEIIRFPARNLICLIYELESIYGITFTEDDLISKNILSVNDLTVLVHNKCKL